jgi:hypothetical protein
MTTQTVTTATGEPLHRRLGLTDEELDAVRDRPDGLLKVLVRL